MKKGKRSITKAGIDMETIYRLTAKGKVKTQEYIDELLAYRKEILDAGLDTANDTSIPTFEDIECDIDEFENEEENEYYNCWGATDEYTLNKALCLKYGEDYLEAEIADKPPKIEFVSYTGKWPALCMGTLTFKVNDKQYEIRNLIAGGETGFKHGYSGEPYIRKGPWSLYEDSLPDELKPCKRLITKMVNENVEQGCCGGCI